MRLEVLVAVVALVGACGDDGATSSSAAPDRTVGIQAFEFDFTSDVPPDFTAGETIRFVVENTGTMDHEMQVLSSTGRRLGQTGRLAPRATAEVVVTFDTAGLYQLICDIDDHLSLGQRAVIQVAEATGG